MKNYQKIIKKFSEEYSRSSPLSEKLHDQAKQRMVDGGSHNLRLTSPFPPRIKSAHGAYIFDEDGHKMVDYWQGHFANILGHNPQEITVPLSDYFSGQNGLLNGFADSIQIEVAELLCRQTATEQVRFTTSGSLATMYAVMLAQAYTKRNWVLKIKGGWHGGHPWGLKGVKYDPEVGFAHLESEGIPTSLGNTIIQTSFNDSQKLIDHFSEFGNKLACFILEPVIGSGGFIPAAKEYLQTARKLTDYFGVVLIFDEIISGFRFRAGDVGRLYGVTPDLITLGKIIGGGMPVAAVAGKQRIMELVGSQTGQRVWFSGGTYSAHPASMLASKIILNHLINQENEIYPRLANLGKLTRQMLIEAFCSEGVLACCTGSNTDLLESSLFLLHFPFSPDARITKPEDACNPALCDLVLSKKVLQLGLLLDGIYILDGKGALSTAHSIPDIQQTAAACKQLAFKINHFA